MPRNPNSPRNPGCGPVHTHTSASENIKLQIMMAKLEDSLKNEFVLKEQLKTINLESLLGSGNIDIKSIDRIEKTSEGLVDTYIIYFNNTEPYSFTVTNGEKGEKGDIGEQGPQGEKGDPGVSGRDIELTKGDTHIQWRYVGETEWKDLVALESLKGADGKDGQNGKDGIDGNDGKDGKDGVNGRDIELINDSEFIQWRYIGDSDWKQLIAVADLKGSDGKDGTNGIDGKDGRDVVITIINGNLVWFYKDEENDPTKHNFIIALADLKGDKGDDGTAFTYDMLTPKQKAELKGEKGDQGLQGEKGDTGAAFTYDMFTPEQLENLKVKGDKGDTGAPGEKGADGKDGLTTAIKIGEITYEQTDGIIELPEIDLASKADNIPFKEDKYVTNSLGKFKAGDSVKGLSITEILAKLLGLVDATPENPETPDSPDDPTGVIETIIQTQIPMYSVTANGELVEIPFKLLSMTEAEAAQAPTQEGFFQITLDSGEVISGYQELQADSDETYYVIALPKIVDYDTMVTMSVYDDNLSVWTDAEKFKLTKDSTEVTALCNEADIDLSHIDTNIYTIWALEDCPTGSKIRFIIHE